MRHSVFGSIIHSEKAGKLAVAPALILTVFLLLTPAVYVLFQSFVKGCSGYAAVLTDQHFSDSLWISLRYTAITVTAQLFLGTMAAVLIHHLGTTSKLVTIGLFAPYAIPSIVAVLSWKFLIEDQGLYAELINTLFGISKTAWKTELAFWSLCLISIWQFYPFVFVSVLARLRNIPQNLYRAAQLDGAGFWSQFRVVTLPQISATLFAVTIVRIAFMFTKFDTAWLFAGKTVVGDVRVLPIYVYLSSFTIGDISIGSSAATLSAIILAILLLGVAALRFVVSQITKYSGSRNDNRVK